MMERSVRVRIAGQVGAVKGPAERTVEEREAGGTLPKGVGTAAWRPTGGQHSDGEAKQPSMPWYGQWVVRARQKPSAARNGRRLSSSHRGVSEAGGDGPAVARRYTHTPAEPTP